ncbi:MAG: FMN-binding protein [Eubacteriaceae bacterium]|nr:FMN-binding protein [Eubacteriaceae bacterium]
MLISMIFAWASVIFFFLSAFKFIARISGNTTLNRRFHSLHLPVGTLFIVTALIHTFFAGNSRSATLFDFQPAAELFSLNWGTACMGLALLIGLTFLLRKQCPRLWMPGHRILTVAFLVCLIFHLVDVGIQLPNRLLGSDQATAPASTSVSTPSPGETVQNPGAANTVTFSGAVLKDGNYEGSAEGYNGTITVSVTVSGGQVTDIGVVSQSDTDRYFSEALSLLDTIIGQQSLEVDAVSGATYSSAGLINAVDSALEGAVVSGTLKVTSIDVSNVRRH